MKKILLAAATVSVALQPLAAQPAADKPTYKLYGFVRGDAAFDTRRNVSANEGLLLLYPLDELHDANGRDINRQAALGLYSFNTRVGLDFGGARAFNAALTAKMEADFAGFGGAQLSNSTVLRIRQAYVKLAWQRSSLTVGQAWHPMVGPVMPDVIALSAGAPFNPFNRSPQLRYDYRVGNFSLAAAAVFQFQFTSPGPDGKTARYQRDALLPELFAGVTYASGGFTAGLGGGCLTLKPLSGALLYDPEDINYGGPDAEAKLYKLDGTLTSFSGVAYLKYVSGLFALSAKSVYGQNLSHLTMLGGYVLTGIGDMRTCDYRNSDFSSSWIGLNYGRKYMAGLFGGYSKNLGYARSLDSAPAAYYGDGATLDALYRLSATFTYNIPHFMLGVEYEMTAACYGEFDAWRGTHVNPRTVTNHRLTAAIAYLF